MAALLLELRLLLLVWRSRRCADSTPQISSDPSPKVADVIVLQACLPLYAVVIGVVGYVHWQKDPHQDIIVHRYLTEHEIWAYANLQTSSGVILDLFLLPQVIANYLRDTDAKVAPLYPLFYWGMTRVRLEAHLFHAVRASNFMPELDISIYSYANPYWDLYSTTWDIIIPCCSVALAILLLMQQKYGGRCFIPERFLNQNYEPVGFENLDL